MARAHTNRRGDQLLLGDEHFEVALRIGLRELLGEGGVAHLSVHRHHRGPGSESFERIPVGFAGRHLVPFLIGREGDVDLAILDGWLARLWFQSIDPEMTDPAQLRDGTLRHIWGQRLAMPAILVLDLSEALSLDGACDHHRRLSGSLPRLLQGLIDLLQVVAIDHDGAASERLDPVAIMVGLPFVFGWAPLAEPVDIEDRGEVREAVVAGLVEALPDGALRQLAVAGEGPYVIRQLIQFAAGERHAYRDRQ